jgi:bifunctional DNA-binding transcriptional regulator/antitoxin component of YhaV-PrlF toxin-antitoxin module
MFSRIDSEGRIGVPTGLRDSLEIEVAPSVLELADRGHGPVAVAPEGMEMPALSAADVRRVLDAVRR